jgi:Tfp pilus assembly protein PilN
MAEFDLNLSTRPFPAYRLINIALAALLVVLAVLSAWQAVGFRRYSKRVRSIRAGEQDTRVEAEALGRRVAEMETRLDRPESAAKLSEIGFLNHLIQRKEFSWTRLFAVLEDLVPPDVHLTSLSPDLAVNGPITLRLEVQARSITDVKVFLERLEQSPVFEKVILNTESKEDKKDLNASTDVDFVLSALYYPQRDTR